MRLGAPPGGGFAEFPASTSGGIKVVIVTVTRTNPPGAPESAASPSSPDAAEPAPGTEHIPSARDGAPGEIVTLALCAAAIGIVFRFVARTPLWLDEALSVNIAKLGLVDINEALRHDGHPPLYYYLLHGWMKAFGSGDVAVRALSGVLSVATLPLAWLAGRRRGGPLLGWVLVSVLSISEFAVRYASETRMYSLVMLLVFIGYLLLDSVTREPGRSWWRLVGLGAVSGLLLLTHYWSMFLLGAVVVTLVWRWRRHHGRRALEAALAVMVGAALMFAPWVGSFVFQSRNTGTPWASPTRPTTTLAIVMQDFHTSTSDFKDPILAIAMSTILVFLGLFGVAVSTQKMQIDLRTVGQVRYEAVVVALTLGMGMVAGLLTRSAFASRYASVIYPLFALIAAAGVTRFTSRPVRFGVLAAYLGFSMLGVVQVALVYQRTQARAIAEAVAASGAQPGDLVVYCPDQLGPGGSREMPPDLR